MLVTFSCDAHENVTMFGSVALKLLHMIGHSGIVPGAILAEDVPDGLERLKHGIALEKPQAKPSDDDNEPEVSLAHRAIPLVSLLQDAVKQKCNVMWDRC